MTTTPSQVPAGNNHSADATNVSPAATPVRKRKRTFTIVTTTVLATGAAVGAAAFSTNAFAGATPSASPSSSASAPAATSSGNSAPSGMQGHQRGTEVSTAVATQVKAAITAKDSAVTVERVMQAPDGSYHAMGTKAGKPVHVQVSKDLKTVTVETGMPGGHGGQPGGGHMGVNPNDKTVSTAVADQVKAAVKAKDASATITAVRQDPDGSYDAIGTKAGQPIAYDISKDLKTVTARTAGAHGPRDGQAPTGTAPSGTAPSSSAAPTTAG